jgi:hypothetical protein
VAASFEDLLAEGASVPVEGWDFSWFEGRATEERPPWGYSRLLAQWMATAHAALDLDTGGGEVLAQIPQPPPVLVATESWVPNLPIARRNLARLGASVVAVDDDGDLPFRRARSTWWSAGTRSTPGGTRSLGSSSPPSSCSCGR